MKKIFITILSFIYLVSGVGFGSVQHYCQNMQEMISPDEDQCCSTEALSDYSAPCQPAEKADSNSCCAAMDTRLATIECETTVSDNCCEIQHKYNQLDNSSLPLNIDINHVASVNTDSFYFYPHNPQTNDGCTSTMFGYPSSTHINLPLLI